MRGGGSGYASGAILVEEFKEFRSSGVQEFRSSGVQEFRSSAWANQQNCKKKWVRLEKQGSVHTIHIY
jgi:hypothetical protein